MANAAAAAPAAPAAPAIPTPAAPAANAPPPLPPDKAGSATPPPPPPPRTFKLKVGGEERELPEDVVLSHAQRRIAEEDGFRKLAEEKKRLAEERAIYEDPERAWETFQKKHGDAWAKKAEEEVIRRFERERLSPEQKTIAQLQAEVEEARREKAAQARAAQDAEIARQNAAYKAEYQAKFRKALLASEVLTEDQLRDENGDPAAVASFIARMSAIEKRNLALAEEAGETLTPEQLVEEMQEEIAAEQRVAFGPRVTGSRLLQRMGPEWVQRVIAASVEEWEAKNGKGAAAPKPVPVSAVRPPPPRDNASGQFVPSKPIPRDEDNWAWRFGRPQNGQQG
jgi:hypothetical protein